MSFHLRAVWNATRNKKAPESRDVISASLCTRLRAPEKGKMRREWLALNGDFQRLGILNPVTYLSGPNKRKPSAKSFRRDVNENCSLGIDCSYHRRACTVD